MRFVVFLLAVSGMSLVLAFITPKTPDTADRWIMGVGVTIALLAAGAAVWLTENPLASAALLPLAFASAIVGNYVPYLTGLWGLEAGDFASADFPAGLAFLSLGTLFLGLVMGLVIEAAHLLVSARMTRLTPGAQGGPTDSGG